MGHACVRTEISHNYRVAAFDFDLSKDFSWNGRSQNHPKFSNQQSDHQSDQLNHQIVYWSHFMEAVPSSRHAMTPKEAPQEMSQSEWLVSIAAFALLVPNAPRQKMAPNIRCRWPHLEKSLFISLDAMERWRCCGCAGWCCNYVGYRSLQSYEPIGPPFGARCWQPTGLMMPVGPRLGAIKF